MSVYKNMKTKGLEKMMIDFGMFLVNDLGIDDIKQDDIYASLGRFAEKQLEYDIEITNQCNSKVQLKYQRTEF